MGTKKSDSPLAYNDVRHVMDIAVKKPGLKYILKTPGKAMNFKKRCNAYRNLMRDMAMEQIANIPGMRAETAYDILVIRQQNDAGEPNRQGCILVFDHEEPLGKLIDPETGSEIEIDGVTNVIIERE